MIEIANNHVTRTVLAVELAIASTERVTMAVNQDIKDQSVKTVRIVKLSG